MFTSPCLGHVRWCDKDPCNRNQGGICLYQEKGLSYSCECKIGYKKLENSDGVFMRCEGII